MWMYLLKEPRRIGYQALELNPKVCQDRSPRHSDVVNLDWINQILSLHEFIKLIDFLALATG